MTFRNLIAFGFLGWVLVLTGILAMGWSAWWLTPLYALGQYQLFHIVAHSGIFASVMLLYNPQKYRAIRLWGLVVAGSVLIEAVQFVAGDLSVTRSLLIDSAFDIGVDLAGAAACWIVLGHHQGANFAQSPA